MVQTVEKYINPLTDFGFKRIFGIDSNRDLLMSLSIRRCAFIF